MKNYFDISGSIEIREVDIAEVACMSVYKDLLWLLRGHIGLGLSMAG